ncbi:hypothetical protein B296_00029752 [Ensete ventricosum]|uniref:Uncharacterized protein n=1 Tax=Ensete ventricosum TaxID=4639 RepID=A0A426ZFD9_ENSVE|nr:hypothetical protein B296_00029752 [Ensete ventricosum]
MCLLTVLSKVCHLVPYRRIELSSIWYTSIERYAQACRLVCVCVCLKPDCAIASAGSFHVALLPFLLAYPTFDDRSTAHLLVQLLALGARLLVLETSRQHRSAVHRRPGDTIGTTIAAFHAVISRIEARFRGNEPVNAHHRIPRHDSSSSPPSSSLLFVLCFVVYNEKGGVFIVHDWKERT